MRGAIAEILQARIRAEETAGFPRLRCIPSSARFYFLDYYNSIPTHERLALHGAHALMGATLFGFPPDKAVDAPRLAAAERYWAKRGWCHNWQHMGYRNLRMLRRLVIEEPNHSLVNDLPPEALTKIQSMETAKAADLRKVAQLAFGQLLGAKPDNKNHGNWVYAGKIENEEVSVHLDYGGRSDQLRYDVRLLRLKPWQKVIGPSYEKLHGFGSGNWDQIEKGSEDQSFALLTELVREVFDISMTVYEKVLSKSG